MSNKNDWADDEVVSALNLSDHELSCRLVEASAEKFSMEGDPEAAQSFVMRNIIKIRNSICGKLDYKSNKESIRNKIDYVKDIATLISTLFPPAILLYAAVAVFRFGVENVCEE